MDDGNNAKLAVKMKAPQLIMFDFDLTISTLHMFKALAGWEPKGPIRPPFAISEVGQTVKAFQLDKTCKGGFASYSLGGPDRIRHLSAFFSDLRKENCELVVCSKGLVGPIRKVLHDANLLQYFTCVYAFTKTDYGTLEFDDVHVNNPPEEVKQFIGGGEYSQFGGKEKLMVHLLEKRGLPKEAGVLVEDDINEIEKASSSCRTLFVDSSQGMMPAHMHKLVHMVTRLASRTSGRQAQPANERPSPHARVGVPANKTPKTSQASIPATLHSPHEGIGVPANIPKPSQASMPSALHSPHEGSGVPASRSPKPSTSPTPGVLHSHEGSNIYIGSPPAFPEARCFLFGVF
eukprot:GEMP01069901.1.p1 GENE.GEMP01069901.1~~GEMP01069901.1.p1  ORF type:complete len:347 (+),score=70.34 GEMP01069901.1:41-1081(+)